MSEGRLRKEDLIEGFLVVHRRDGVGRVAERFKREFQGKETDYVKIGYRQGDSRTLPVDLVIESGHFFAYDGPESNPLGRLSTGQRQRDVWSRPRGLEHRAADLLNEVGIFHPEILVERLRKEGYRVAPGQLEELSGQRLVDGYLVSTDHRSHMAQAVRALHHIAVDDPEEIISGLRRFLQSKSAVKSGTNRMAAETYVYETVNSWGGWPAPTTEEDIYGHFDLVRYLESQGGVVKVSDLDSYVKSELSHLNWGNQAGNSPLLERVGNGVIGVRGAPIDLVAIEGKRNKTKGGWALWGRLDRNRAWVEVTSYGDKLKARLMNDCVDLLGVEPYPLYSETGTSVGTLEIVTEGGTREVNIDWLYDRPVDWLPEEHSAVVEFRVGSDRSASLLSGSSTREPDPPRYTDGCVLVQGKWCALIELTQSVIDGGGTNIPLRAVSRGVEMKVGEVSTLAIEGVRGKSVRLTREPHTLRLDGLSEANPEGQVDGFALVLCGEQQCQVLLANATSDPTTRLHRCVGLFERPRLFWSAIGDALGWGNEAKDRQQVRLKLAERLRFDLVELTHEAKPTKTSEGQDVDPDDFRVVDGYLCRDSGDTRTFTDGHYGTGLFGLLWKKEPGGDGEIDPRWAERTLTFIRAWSAGNSDQALVIRKEEAGWTTSLHPETCTTLREALDLAATAPNTFAPVQHSTCFPTSNLGYLEAYQKAENQLRKLEISESGWWAEDDSGNSSGPTPMAALNGDGDAQTP